MKRTTAFWNTERKADNAYGLRNAVAEQTALAVAGLDDELQSLRLSSFLASLEEERAEMQAQEDERARVALVKRRMGCGTAWVNGTEINRALPPVVLIPKTRKIVVQVNHKLCIWHLAM